MSDADKIGKLHEAFKVADAIEAGEACAVCGAALADDMACGACVMRHRLEAHSQREDANDKAAREVLAKLEREPQMLPARPCCKRCQAALTFTHDGYRCAACELEHDKGGIPIGAYTLADELAKDAAADALHQQREAGRAAAAGASMLLEASQEMINGAHIWRGALVRYPSSDAPHTIGRVESVAAPDGRGEEYAGQVLIQWPQGSAWQYAARLEVLEPAAAVWALVCWLHRSEGGADAAMLDAQAAREALDEVRGELEACKADRQRAQAKLAQQGARLSQALEDRAVLAARLEEARGDAKMAATQLYDAQAELAENAKELREVRADLKAAAADALQQRQTLEGERALAAREKAALRVELADARHDAAFADMAPDIALAKMLSSLQAGRDERMAAALALVEAEAQRQRVKWGEHVSRAKLHDLLAAEVGLVMMADAGGHVRVRLCKLAALALRAMQTPAPALEVSPAPAAAAPRRRRGGAAGGDASGHCGCARWGERR